MPPAWGREGGGSDRTYKGLKLVASWEEADLGANLGLGFPMSQGGLLAYRQRIGDDAIRRQFEVWKHRYGPRFHL